MNAAGGALGRKFVADFITYPGDPDSAVGAATRAVQRDGALFITGMTPGSVSTALIVKLRALNVLMMEVFARPDFLTRKGCSSNVTIFGSDAINLAKQQQQFGLFKKYKMVMGSSFAIPQTLSAQGESALGVYQTLGFTPAFPNPEAKTFVQSYQQRYPGELPAFTSADQYAGIELIADAIKTTNCTDLDAVRNALTGMKTKTVIGDVEIRAGDHQAIRPVSINQIVPGDGGGLTYALKTIEAEATIIPPVDPSCRM